MINLYGIYEIMDKKSVIQGQYIKTARKVGPLLTFYKMKTGI